MGTKVQCERYRSGFIPMRDPNEGSSSCNWPLVFGDKSSINVQYNNGCLARPFSNSYPVGNQDAIKQKMLEHEAVFRHQVVELHRLYRTQKEMMEEMKRNEQHRNQNPVETSSSSSPLMSQKPNIPFLHSHPILNSNPILKINSPSLSSARGDHFLSQNGVSDCEILEVRPSKVRKKLFDLQRPGDEYIDQDEEQPNLKHMNLQSKLKGECNNGDAYNLSSSRSRNPKGLADLNEPVPFEEPSNRATAESSTSSRFLLGLSKEVLENPQLRSGNGVSSSNVHNESKGDDGRGRSSNTYEGHNNKANLNFIPHGTQQHHSLVFQKPMDIVPFDRVHHPRSIFDSTQSSGDNLWREKERSTMHTLQNPETSSLFHHKPVSTLTQKLSQPPLNSFGTSNTSSQSQGIVNRLYPGPRPSWMKDPPPRLPLNGLENSKNYMYDKVASERSINYSPSKRHKEVNLNVCPSRSSYIEIVDVEKESEEDHSKVLPWMKKPNPLGAPLKVSEKKIFGVPIFDRSCSAAKKDASSVVSTSASLKVKGKGVMIDINVALEDSSTGIGQEEKPLIIVEKSGAASSRALLDLNSCASEDEITVVPSLASTTVNRRIMIDLEAPPVSESDEDVFLPLIEQQPQDDEAILNAAEAIFTITSSSQEDSFLWFVETVCDFENSRNLQIETMDEFEALTMSLRDMSVEEYMPEPLVPEFPEAEENRGVENGNAASARNRSRRGVARRGTRKRDFQRDILPGLISLSRHEVSEDIQTFGGLMRATGHVWSSGLTRRNGGRGGGRGRRRVVVAPPPPVDDVAEPAATACPSLTEAVDIWGRTPRRPRRQRGTPGNPPNGLAQ